jgi:hypothetical protein
MGEGLQKGHVKGLLKGFSKDLPYVVSIVTDKLPAHSRTSPRLPSKKGILRGLGT